MPIYLKKISHQHITIFTTLRACHDYFNKTFKILNNAFMWSAQKSRYVNIYEP